jgi:hypothetical protein
MVFISLLLVAAAMLCSFNAVDAFQFQHKSLQNSSNRSRRNVLVTITSYHLISSILPPSASAKDESMNYQAVWFDPKHPNGYRTLFGNDRKATLLFRDDPSDEEQLFPVQVIGEGDGTKLLFDLSGRQAEGILTRNRDGIRIISFDNDNGNNSFWINKKFEGPIGIYRDKLDPKRAIIIRQVQGSECVVEIRDGDSGKVLSTLTAKAGNTFSFNFPEGEVRAAFDMFRRTLTFDDGTVWTKY